jgi:hypothetical protein
MIIFSFTVYLINLQLRKTVFCVFLEMAIARTSIGWRVSPFFQRALFIWPPSNLVNYNELLMLQ